MLLKLPACRCLWAPVGHCASCGTQTSDRCDGRNAPAPFRVRSHGRKRASSMVSARLPHPTSEHPASPGFEARERSIARAGGTNEPGEPTLVEGPPSPRSNERRPAAPVSSRPGACVGVLRGSLMRGSIRLPPDRLSCDPAYAPARRDPGRAYAWAEGEGSGTRRAEGRMKGGGGQRFRTSKARRCGHPPGADTGRQTAETGRGLSALTLVDRSFDNLRAGPLQMRGVVGGSR